LKKIVIDLDNTLTLDNSELSYEDMKTYADNIGKINIYTLPVILNWLEHHHVPFDEVVVGKPWCSEEEFYIHDRAIRPKEFIKLNAEQISDFLNY